MVLPPSRFVSLATAGAGLARIVFGHQDDLHPTSLGLVGEHVTHLAAGHLVDALVAHVPIVFVFPACSQVANSERLDANPVEH